MARAQDARAQKPPVAKVYILAGQSNMEGKVQNILLEHQAKDPKTKALFAHLRKDDAWRVREDVWIQFGKRKGGLTMGYGSNKRTGIELEFGAVIGDACEPPVVLLKTAWGGHSLFKQFRPPSAGMPAPAVLEKELADAIKKQERRNKKNKRKQPLPTMAGIRKVYGSSYRKMMSQVAELQAEYKTRFPALANHRLEIAGFVWFQGWNDQYNGYEKHYETNMAKLIQDIRRAWKLPKLPVVIGVMGQNGSKPAKGAMKVIQDAQLAIPKIPEFRGNVTAVHTDRLIDKAAEALYPTWRKNLEEWKKTGSDHGYHYLGSAIWHLRMGRAFATAMLALERPR